MKYGDRGIPQFAWLSHPARGGWIEMTLIPPPGSNRRSHPTRGGWIEMPSCSVQAGSAAVPPRTGWVD